MPQAPTWCQTPGKSSDPGLSNEHLKAHYTEDQREFFLAQSLTTPDQMQAQIRLLSRLNHDRIDPGALQLLKGHLEVCLDIQSSTYHASPSIAIDTVPSNPSCSADKHVGRGGRRRGANRRAN